MDNMTAWSATVWPATYHDRNTQCLRDLVIWIETLTLCSTSRIKTRSKTLRSMDIILQLIGINNYLVLWKVLNVHNNYLSTMMHIWCHCLDIFCTHSTNTIPNILYITCSSTFLEHFYTVLLFTRSVSLLLSYMSPQYFFCAFLAQAPQMNACFMSKHFYLFLVCLQQIQ